MALGSTYQFHLKTDSDASTLGSLAETFGGAWLNVAENFFDSGKSILNGDVMKGIQQASPHILRDLVKAGLMSQNGLMNNAGQHIIPADQVSGPELFAQSLGFRPEHLAEVQDRNNAERAALADVQGTRKSLIQKYVSTTEPSERQAVWNKVKEFNQAHPGFALTYSTLHQATVAQQEKDREMQQYGVRLKSKQLPEITREGEPYKGPIRATKLWLGRRGHVLLCTWIWRLRHITISSMTGLELRRSNPIWWAKGLGWVLNKIQSGHCEKAIAADMARAQVA